MDCFRNRRFLRAIMLPLCISLLTACQGWVGIRTAPGTASTIEGPVRIRLQDGRELMLDRVALTPDSLFGTPAYAATTESARTVRIARGEVTEMARRGTDGGKTTLLVLGVVGLAVVSAVAFTEVFGKGIEQTIGSVGGR